MKFTTTIAAGALAVLALAVVPAKAATYGDTTGDVFTGAGGGILDITSVEVNNNATDLIFKINLAGDPSNPTDWGKYMISFDTVGGGDAVGNGWARPISLTTGMDYWVGSWVDSGNGAEVWKYTGAWGMQSATYAANPDSIGVAKNTSSVTLTFKYAGLGLAPGNSFNFDVYTSGGGGGDSAVDSLANPSVAIGDWGGPYSSALANSYTITPVPEPASLALLGLGGLLAWSRVTRRRS